MNALTLLMDDHKTLKRLLSQGEETTERAVKTRRELLERVTTELRAHEKIEEDILYPALKEHPKAKDIVLEGYQEHHVADLLLEELHEMDVTDERWGAKFKVLTSLEGAGVGVEIARYYYMDSRNWTPGFFSMV